MTNDMKGKKRKQNKDLEYLQSVWHHLPWWLRTKIFLIVIYYAETRWFREIPLRWIEYQIRKDK